MPAGGPEGLQYTGAHVSALVASFSRLRDAGATRPLIHLPVPGRSLTTEDVWQAHCAESALLRRMGLGRGDLLVTAVGNRPSAVSLLLAARGLDVALLAVDRGATPAEISDLCRRFGAAAVVAPVEQAAGLGTLAGAVSDGCVLVACADDRRAASGTYDGVAILKLTSGSTGAAKATRTTEPQLVADSEQIVAAMGIGPDDTQIAVIPLSHAYGLSVILVPLLLQGTPIVLRDAFVPHQLPDDARRFAARTFAGVPYMFEYFLGNPPDGGWPATLGRLISAGAPLPAETVRGFLAEFGTKIHSFYGASESGGISYDDEGGGDSASTVGHPLPGVTITLRPEHGLPSGTGRVHVRSGAVSAGYVGGGEGEEFSDGGFLTGDYGKFDARGRLVLTGRVSSFINVAGRKVHPADVEAVLRSMPGIRDVRVVAAPDAQRGQQVAACIVPERPEAVVSTMAIRRFCAGRLASHKIPRVIVTLDRLPLTARGKLDTRAIDDAVRAAIVKFPEQLC